MKAEALVSKVDSQLNDAEALTSGIPQAKRKRVLFILSLQGSKIQAAGSDTAANGIIGLATAVNAVEGFSDYKQLTAMPFVLPQTAAV